MLNAVTRFVPNRVITRVLSALEKIVPSETIADSMPPYAKGTRISVYIAGHAAPKSESGVPSPIKAEYITAKSNVAMFPPERYFYMCGRPQRKFYHSIFAFASIFHNARGKKQRAAKKPSALVELLIHAGYVTYSRRNR